MEEVDLESVVRALVKRLCDRRLRTKSINRGGISCIALWKIYKILLQMQKNIKAKRQVEEQLAAKKRFKILEEILYNGSGLTVDALLAQQGQTIPKSCQHSLPTTS